MSSFSLQFTLYKLTQFELRAYGPLQLLNPSLKLILFFYSMNNLLFSDFGTPQFFEDLSDPRKIIETYKLNQSQFVCSLAVFPNPQQSPIIYDVSTVYSQIINAITTQINEEDIDVRCSPRRGDCLGGEEILLVIPKVDKRKGLSFFVK